MALQLLLKNKQVVLRQTAVSRNYNLHTLPNIFSNQKLNPKYIENTFRFQGDSEVLQPIKIPIIDFTEIRIKENVDDIYVKLIDSKSGDNLSILALKKMTINKTAYYEIKISKSYINRKGYLKHLFLVLVYDYNYKLVSDNLHTIPGSMNFWKNIKNENQVQCFTIKPLTNYKRKYINQEDYKIWGISEEYFDDNELNMYAIEDLYNRNVINDSYYGYVIENENFIKDCSGIRLTIEKK